MDSREEKQNRLGFAALFYEECVEEFGEKSPKTKKAKLVLERAQEEYRRELLGYDIPRAPQDLMKFI